MLGFRPLTVLPLADVPERQRHILARTGIYSLSGKDVTLKRGLKLAAAAGSFTLTGQDVSIILSISQASIYRALLVGSTANIIHGYKMISNFNMTAGDTKQLVITVKDADGDAVSITGSSIKWQCARSLGKASVLSKTTSSGIQITDGANGVFVVTLSPSDTESLVGNYYHESQITFSDNTVSTVLVGTMTVKPALIEAT